MPRGHATCRRDGTWEIRATDPLIDGRIAYDITNGTASRGILFMTVE